MQCVVVLFGQFVKGRPARKLRWNRVVLDPGAVRIKVEIVLRLDRGIHVLWVERRRIFLVGCRGSGRTLVGGGEGSLLGGWVRGILCRGRFVPRGFREQSSGCKQAGE